VKETQRPEENLDRQIQRAVATDRELQVKTLWENTKEKSLKSSKPEQPKQLGVVDLKEDTCHQIMNSR
jgi:hypothetical protein